MRDLGKLIVAKDFKKLPKVQKIAQSGHTAMDVLWHQSTLANETEMMEEFSPSISKQISIESF